MLTAARAALGDLFDEDNSIIPGTPIVGAEWIKAEDVCAVVYQFAITKLDKYLLAAGGIGRAELRAARRRAEAAARRAVVSLGIDKAGVVNGEVNVCSQAEGRAV